MRSLRRLYKENQLEFLRQFESEVVVRRRRGGRGIPVVESRYVGTLSEDGKAVT
jgi:hypothetical protein